MLKFLLSQFIKKTGRNPNAIEMLQLKFKASQGTGQVIPFPQKRSFGEEIDSMIKKGEVKIGTADKTPPYKPSKSQTDFEIQERYRADNAKAIKRFEDKMKKDPEDMADGGVAGLLGERTEFRWGGPPGGGATSHGSGRDVGGGGHHGGGGGGNQGPAHLSHNAPAPAPKPTYQNVHQTGAITQTPGRTVSTGGPPGGGDPTMTYTAPTPKTNPRGFPTTRTIKKKTALKRWQELQSQGLRSFTQQPRYIPWGLNKYTQGSAPGMAKIWAGTSGTVPNAYSQYRTKGLGNLDDLLKSFTGDIPLGKYNLPTGSEGVHVATKPSVAAGYASKASDPFRGTKWATKTGEVLSGEIPTKFLNQSRNMWGQKQAIIPADVANKSLLGKNVNLSNVKNIAKPVSKFMTRAVPVAGGVISAADAAYRANQGDWLGSALSAGSAVPGWGLAPLAAQVGTDWLGLTGSKRQNQAQGGPARQNFGIGGMSRRAFLKLMGSGVAGIGAAKSGLFSFLKGGGKKAAVNLVTTPNVAGKPVWFDALVNKVIREGDDVSKKFGTKDLEVVHTKKINDFEEVTVTRELDTGDILVEYGPHMTDEAGKVIRASNEPGVVRFQYKKGEEIYDTGKGHLSTRKSVKEPDTFNAVESEPRITDWDGTIEMDGENIVNNVDELLTDTNKLKQYATGKNPTIRELLDGRKKQKYKQTLEENPSEQINYIENKGGGYTSIDDMIDEGARVGDLEPRGYDVKGINLPEKKADGGRMGYGKGDIVTKGIPFVLKEIRALLKNKKKVKQAVDDIYPTGDYKYDSEMAADALVENNPKEFKGLLREDLSDNVSSEVYGAVLGPIQNNALIVSRMKRATKPTETLKGIEKTGTMDISNPGIADEFTRFMKETNPKGYKDLEEKVIIESFDPKGKKGHASGGLAGMLGE